MLELVSPHGSGSLKPLLLDKGLRDTTLIKAKKLKQVPMSSRETSDVLMLGMGAYTPLKGFMGQADWRGVSENMQLQSGIFWPIPITLSAENDLAACIRAGEEVSLTDADTGEVMAIMSVEEKYKPDKELECKYVFRTTDSKHPGVAKVMRQGAVNLSGPIKVVNEGELPKLFKDLYIRPAESREIFASKGWSRVAAFQTRNPMHRSHEYLVKIALEMTDGVFVHQVLGKLKPGDIPANVRTAAIQKMIEHYFKRNTIIQGGYPIEMRYAGPREALLHALIRQNFGCSHLIVGRDHAGVANYYGPLDAQNIFDELWEGALVTKPIKIGITFYCKKCYGMATERTCPHADVHHISISGTEQRKMLSSGQDIPVEFSRPEVVDVLRQFYQGEKTEP